VCLPDFLPRAPAGRFRSPQTRQLAFHFRHLNKSPEIGDARGAVTISINRLARHKETATVIHDRRRREAASSDASHSTVSASTLDMFGFDKIGQLFNKGIGWT
jgi:hypothetical protein